MGSAHTMCFVLRKKRGLTIGRPWSLFASIEMAKTNVFYKVLLVFVG